jgi:predicted ATPase
VVAETLAVRDDGRPLPETLANALRSKALLLVLDNLEHLAEAAPFIAELLAACPRLGILATSRAPLRLRGEREFPVPPLPLPRRKPPPSPAQLSLYDAVRLLAAEAVRERSGQPVAPDDAENIEQTVTRLRAALAPSTREEAWAAGRARSIDGAIDEAMAVSHELR